MCIHHCHVGGVRAQDRYCRERSYKVMCILTVMLEELELGIDTEGREVIK